MEITMTDDEQSRPAEEGTSEGGDPIAQVAQSGDAAKDDERDPGDQVPDVLESAAELGLGAVIAPFTGGETVNIVGSVASMLEAGYDRLTHLGEHETPAEAEPPADDGGPDDGSG
jgi:hypothetical protein